MQSRDLFDPKTLVDVAHQVETVERLRLLTLLTYADISAVNPTVMTPWRADQLWQLYLMVYNELTRELEAERIESIPSGPPERVAFLQGLSHALSAHAHGSGDRRAHGAQGQEPRAQGFGGRSAEPGERVAVNVDRDRPARVIRLRRRYAGLASG